MKLLVCGVVAALAACALAACGDESTPPPPEEQLDASSPDISLFPPRDAGSDPLDAGFTPADAAFAGLDASAARPDAATPSPDAGRPDAGGRDAGVPGRDAGSGPDASDPGPDVLNPGWIGGPCSIQSDCPFTNGMCLTQSDGYPAGTCTEACTRTCPDQAGPLNTTTFCINDGDGDADGLCMSRCDFTLSPETGCRKGYVCMPEKRMGEPTTIREVCIPIGGVPGRAEPPFDIGNACTSDSQCNRNVCLAGLPSGYCTQQSCDVVGCPAGSTCWAIGNAAPYFYGCLKDCVTNNDCRVGDGYECADHACWPAPPPEPTCTLTGGAQDCYDWSSQSSTDFVVVTKHLRRISLCQGTQHLGSWCVGLGYDPVNDKVREGDGRTPEGIFYIPQLVPNSSYYKAFLISYPDAGDAQRGLAAGMITQSEYNAIVAAQNAKTTPPQNTALGGLVEIHGGGSGADWTLGCIAADNTTIDVLWNNIGVGDTAVILH